jgi:hypothetical protein
VPPLRARLPSVPRPITLPKPCFEGAPRPLFDTPCCCRSAFPPALPSTLPERYAAAARALRRGCRRHPSHLPIHFHSLPAPHLSVWALSETGLTQVMHACFETMGAAAAGANTRAGVQREVGAACCHLARPLPRQRAAAAAALTRRAHSTGPIQSSPSSSRSGRAPSNPGSSPTARSCAPRSRSTRPVASRLRHLSLRSTTVRFCRWSAAAAWIAFHAPGPNCGRGWACGAGGAGQGCGRWGRRRGSGRGDWR